jgi:di/tricarboxylate transporter
VSIKPLEMFTVTPVGLPVAIVGLLYILLFGRVLLRAKRQEGIPLERSRSYTTSMRVGPGSPVVGKALEETDLHQIPGAWLNRIEREGITVTGAGLAEALREGDVLVFVGVLESIKDLRQVRGLEPIVEGDEDLVDEHPHYEHRSNLRLIEAVLSSSSPLIGRRVRDAGIRSRYSAVVVAVHRLGHQLHGTIGEVRLKPGDTLLLEAAPGFEKRYRDSTDFYLVSESEEPAAPRHDRAWVALGVMGLFVAMLGAGQFIDGLPEWAHRFKTVMSPMPAAMIAAGLMVLTRCCRGAQARRSVDWSVLVVIGAAFGLGAAMQSSGLSAMIAHPLVGLASSLGPVAAIALIYAMTVIFTTFVTNSAAAVLMFPIAYEVAAGTGMNLMPMAVCIAIAASAEFTTPIGYHTNLMVMGPGGYRFMDYVRFGGPLTLISGVVAVTSAALWFGLT